MSASSNDHFSRVAHSYAANRPGYPAALFDWLAGQCARRHLALDCATGNGQAAVDLAARFASVVATDVSAAQIAKARPAANIAYRVADADASGLDDGAADLVTIAQALHWLDLERFYGEVRRVLRPDGMIAAWTYGVQRVEGASVDALVQRFYAETVGPYWPAERRTVETGYRDLAFPFARLQPPPFEMHADWTLAQLLGYFASWSATGRYVEANGADPVAMLRPELARLWGDPERRRRVTWPLGMLAGRVS